MTSCPCGLGEPYPSCCGRYHRGEPAPTAEALMRARYSAFALGDEGFLRDTWHAGSRPAGPLLDADLTWTGLSITDRSGGGLLQPDGTVEFTARFRRPDGSTGRLRERSRFVRERDGWRYLGPA